MKRILITGGAGYIGSHLARSFHQAGHTVTIIDNFSRGNRDAVRKTGVTRIIEKDLCRDDITRYLTGTDVVFHCAAFIDVAESVKHPQRYYINNVLATANLLEQMRQTGIKNIIFSSTAAVYGAGRGRPWRETDQKKPIQPYGFTKSVMEDWIGRYSRTHQGNAVIFRYFNAAGTDDQGILGENHKPETHLIPRALQTGKSFKVFGDDYPTADGTCIRDYIHVEDIVAAYHQALIYMKRKTGFHVFNLGSQKGYSVLEVLSAIKQVTGIPVRYTVTKRRPGDPAILVADASRARRLLGWRPSRTLADMIRSQRLHGNSNDDRRKINQDLGNWGQAFPK